MADPAPAPDFAPNFAFQDEGAATAYLTKAKEATTDEKELKVIDTALADKALLADGVSVRGSNTTDGKSSVLDLAWLAEKVKDKSGVNPTIITKPLHVDAAPEGRSIMSRGIAGVLMGGLAWLVGDMLGLPGWIIGLVGGGVGAFTDIGKWVTDLLGKFLGFIPGLKSAVTDVANGQAMAPEKAAGFDRAPAAAETLAFSAEKGTEKMRGYVQVVDANTLKVTDIILDEPGDKHKGVLVDKDKALTISVSKAEWDSDSAEKKADLINAAINSHTGGAQEVDVNATGQLIPPATLAADKALLSPKAR